MKEKKFPSTAEVIESIASDPMCVPQLNDPFEPETPYAQLMRNYIEFCLSENEIELSEDPTMIIIY